MPRKTVQLVLVCLAGLVGLFDVGLLLDGVEGNTISSIVQDSGWVIGLLGFTAVHVSRKPDGIKRSWGLVATGAAIAGIVAHFVGGGVIALILGGVAGWFAWGNSGRS